MVRLGPKRNRGRGRGSDKETAHKRKTEQQPRKRNQKRNESRRRRQRQRRQRNDTPKKLETVQISKNSIHSSWKRELGGLIRYYVNVKCNTFSNNDMTRQQAEKEAQADIDRMYYQTGCCTSSTKAKILESLGMRDDMMQNGEYIDMEMAIEKDGGTAALCINPQDIPSALVTTEDGKGVILQQVKRSGEGPAHSSEEWTNIVVPSWAMDKSFFFQVKNHCPLHLSCEVTLDGHRIAKNAPLPATSSRTIKPDSSRYFQSHKWILKAAKKVKFQPKANVSNEENIIARQKPKTPRYNGIRPDYRGQRVSSNSYPDPSVFGWTFTGSVENSKVEFFEKSINMGVVKLDWYYTTATVKTVLDHPSTGRNQLFRNTVSPEQYVEIMRNPRAHSGRGYRSRENRPGNQSVDMDANMQMDESEDEFDKVFPSMANESDTALMEQESDSGGVSENSTSVTYFAKNDAYDFKTEGHQNRRNEMNKLHQSAAFAQWEEAAKKEWAVIHAKFYISLPKRMFNTSTAPSRHGGASRGGKERRELEPLPEQSTVVDIKSAERCTLGTDFFATGPAQSKRRSRVRMDRIQGLTDDEEWRGAPLFEKKLYYRAEDVIEGRGFGYQSELDGDLMEDEDDMNDNNGQADSEPPLSLEDYKMEKIEQVAQYHLENTVYNPDPEVALDMLRNCQMKIRMCENANDVDEWVKIFHDDLIKNELNASFGVQFVAHDLVL